MEQIGGTDVIAAGTVFWWFFVGEIAWQLVPDWWFLVRRSRWNMASAMYRWQHIRKHGRTVVCKGRASSPTPHPSPFRALFCRCMISGKVIKVFDVYESSYITILNQPTNQKLGGGIFRWFQILVIAYLILSYLYLIK